MREPCPTATSDLIKPIKPNPNLPQTHTPLPGPPAPNSALRTQSAPAEFLARIFHSLRAGPGSGGCVAQVSNLLYRRLPVGRLYLLGRICGLEIRDTADWKSALRLPVGETREIPGLGFTGCTLSGMEYGALSVPSYANRCGSYDAPLHLRVTGGSKL